MRILLTPAAQRHISANGSTLTIRIEKKPTIFGCCGPAEIPYPVLRLGKPAADELAEYQRLILDSVEVYSHTSLADTAAGGQLTVELERTIFSKKLVLYGVKAEDH